jgi:hypothetical protein
VAAVAVAVVAAEVQGPEPAQGPRQQELLRAVRRLRVPERAELRPADVVGVAVHVVAGRQRRSRLRLRFRSWIFGSRAVWICRHGAG